MARVAFDCKIENVAYCNPAMDTQNDARKAAESNFDSLGAFDRRLINNNTNNVVEAVTLNLVESGEPAFGEWRP